MRTKALLFLLMVLFQLQAVAKGTYEVKLKVVSLATQQPIDGVQVMLRQKKRTILVGLTDDLGEIVLKELKGDYNSVDIIDPSGEFQNSYAYFNKPDQDDFVITVGLRFNPKQEDVYFSAIDKKYENDSLIYDYLEPKVMKAKFGESAKIEDPVFKGGTLELHKFIVMNLRYPEDAMINDAQGRVYVSYIVEKDGQVSHVKIYKGISPGLDEEAIRLIRYLPAYEPCKVNGVPTRCRIAIPINFSIN